MGNKQSSVEEDTSSVVSELFASSGFNCGIDNDGNPAKPPPPTHILLPYQYSNDVTEKYQKQKATKQPPYVDIPNVTWEEINALFGATDDNPTNAFNEKRLLHIFETIGQMNGKHFVSFLSTMDAKSAKSDSEMKYSQLFYSVILPFMAKVLLMSPQIFGDNYKLESITPFSNGIVNLTCGQCCAILICFFFGIYGTNFSELLRHPTLTATQTKFQCWIEYFNIARQNKVESKWFTEQIVTYHRRFITESQFCNVFQSDTFQTLALQPFVVETETKIEDEPRAMHVDFANQYIGGGVLVGGNVQEEIMFSVGPECLISMLLSPFPMRGNESIIIMGARQYFNYSGYGSRFTYEGIRSENESKEENSDGPMFCELKPNRLATANVAIDALCMPGNAQIKKDRMIREIIKAYTGFSVDRKEMLCDASLGSRISTGNWGCGIFGGDKQLKALLQWIAASLCGRAVTYATFSKFERGSALSALGDITKALLDKSVTVGQLWDALCDRELCERYTHGAKQCSVFQHISSHFKLGINL